MRGCPTRDAGGKVAAVSPAAAAPETLVRTGSLSETPEGAAALREQIAWLPGASWVPSEPSHLRDAGLRETRGFQLCGGGRDC